MTDFTPTPTPSDNGQLRVSGETGFHSYSLDEVRAFTSYINEVLKFDQSLTSEGQIPIDASSDELFRAIADGAILCQLICTIKPELIHPSTITLHPKNQFEALANLQAVLFSCKQLGISTVNIGPEDIYSGQKPHLVLGLVWQLVRCHLTSRINVMSTPRLTSLMHDGETPDYFARLPAEANLLRWVNYHLARANCPRQITNFSTDVADSEAYDILLHQLAPAACPRINVPSGDRLQRAEAVLSNAERLGCRQFLTPTELVNGNPKLNVAFVAYLFNKHPGLAPPTSEEERSRCLFAENQMKESMAREEAQFHRSLQAARAQFEQQLAEEKTRLEQEFHKAREAEENARRQQLEQSAMSLEGERRKMEAERESLARDRVAFEERRGSFYAASTAGGMGGSGVFQPPPVQMGGSGMFQPPPMQMGGSGVFQPPPLQMGISSSAPVELDRSQFVEFGTPPPPTRTVSYQEMPSSGSFYGASAQVQQTSFHGMPPPVAAAASSYYPPPAPAAQHHPGSFFGMPPPSVHGQPGSFYPPTVAQQGSSYGAMPPMMGAASVYGGHSSFVGYPMAGGMYGSSAMYPSQAPTMYSTGSIYAMPPQPYGVAQTTTTATTTTMVSSPVLQFPLARVRVTIEEAHDVAKKDLFGLAKSDPYCILAFKTERYTTRKCSNTTHPVWYEDIVLQNVNPGDELVVAMWDCDRFKKDDFLGEIRVFAKDFIFGQPQSYRLLSRRGYHDRVHGSLQLKFQLI